MARLNPATGLWEDDADGPAPPQEGALGAQVNTPQGAPFPPPTPAEGIAPPVAPAPPVPAQLPDTMSANPPAPTPLAAPAPAAPPALPTVDPYKPGAPVPVPPSRVVSPAESQTLGQIDANTAARAQTTQDEGALAKLRAGANDAAAQRDEAERQRHQQEQQRIVDESQKRQQALQAKATADWDAYRQMGIKDPEASQSFGHRILAAIAIGLGEYASIRGGGPNRAAQLIKDANDQNIALQKAAIEKKYKEAERSGADVTAAKSEMQDQLRALDLKHSALLDASAGKLKTELARLGVPEAQIAANKDVQQIEAEALGKRELVNQGIREDETKLTAAQIAADAKKKAAGAGGGSVKPGAIAQLKQAIVDGKDGRPLNAAEIQDVADKLGIPAVAKAGHPSVENLTKDVAFVAGQNNKPGTAGSVRQNAVLGNLAEAEKAAKDISPGGVSEDTIRKLQTNEEQAKAGEHSASSGVLGSLATRFGRATGLVARGRYDGIPEDEQKKITAAEQVITHLTEMQQGKNIETLEQYRERYSPYIPGLSRAEVLRRERALPGLVAEQRAIQDPGGVGKKRVEAAGEGGAPGGKAAAAERVWNDPKAPAAARARAKKYLDSIKSNGGDPADDTLVL